jgi:hypothetical protein
MENEKGLEFIYGINALVAMALDYIDNFCSFYKLELSKRLLPPNRKDMFDVFMVYLQEVSNNIGDIVMDRVAEEAEKTIISKEELPFGSIMYMGDIIPDNKPTFIIKDDSLLSMFRDFIRLGEYGNTAFNLDIIQTPVLQIEKGRGASLCTDKVARRLISDGILSNSDNNRYKLDRLTWSWLISTMTRMPLNQHMDFVKSMQKNEIDKLHYQRILESPLNFSMLIQGALTYYYERLSKTMCVLNYRELEIYCRKVADIIWPVKGQAQGVNLSGQFF